MKIIIILATGALITFTPDPRANSDCFSKGYEIVQKIATYYEPGPNQGWVLNDSNIEVAGWYCR
jgi:hypothetical protein